MRNSFTRNIIAICIFVSILFTAVFGSFIVVLVADEKDGNNNMITFVNLPPEVLQWRSLVEKYAAAYRVSEYVDVLLAIIMVESGGTLEDVMQSSESMGLPPNSLKPEASIKQGCKYFSSLIDTMKKANLDLDSVIQAYNYGGGFLNFVKSRGKQYTFDLAEEFAKQKSKGEKVSYLNPIAIEKNGGWRYNYGNMFYVLLVQQYLMPVEFDGDLVNAVMKEALKYQGWKYVFGGASPTTSFDCSGLTQWCYRKAGINLPRTAQQQYDATAHIPIEQARPGDLVFFENTYQTSDWITHVGIYVGDMKMFNAQSSGIKYADISPGSHFGGYLVCAGRPIK